jgi:hypothetical protein
MKGTPHSEEQIIAILKQGEPGLTTAETHRPAVIGSGRCRAGPRRSSGSAIVAESSSPILPRSTADTRACGWPLFRRTRASPPTAGCGARLYGLFRYFDKALAVAVEIGATLVSCAGVEGIGRLCDCGRFASGFACPGMSFIASISCVRSAKRTFS